MSVLSPNVAVTSDSSSDSKRDGATPSNQPPRHHWTIEEYDKLSAARILGEQRTELMDGEILDMSPQNDPHRVAVGKLLRELISIFPKDYLITSQSTLRLKSGHAPEPDAAVEIPQSLTPGRNVIVHPLLVAEVSDDTLLYDRMIKASLYAANAISDYWLVNLVERRVEVYREPIPDASQRYGWKFGQVTVYRSGDSIAPLAKPDWQVAVGNVLP